MPGVIAVLTGKELKTDGIGNLICGWMIHSKNGKPMNMGAWSPLAVDRVPYVGDAVAIVVAETKGQARDAAEAVDATYKEKKSVTDAVAALKNGAPQLHPEADGNLIYDWEIGDAAATDKAIKSAAHVTKMHIVNNRLVPNAMEQCLSRLLRDHGQTHRETVFTLMEIDDEVLGRELPEAQRRIDARGSRRGRGHAHPDHQQQTNQTHAGDAGHEDVGTREPPRAAELKRRTASWVSGTLTGRRALAPTVATRIKLPTLPS
jgi:hypothetical protein